MVVKKGDLFERFRRDLANQRDEFLAAISQDPSDLNAVKEAAHKLAGASGQLGLPRLGRLAAFLDQMLDGLARAGIPPTPLELATLQHVGALIENTTLQQSQGTSSVLLYGLPDQHLESIADILDELDYAAEIAEDADEFDHFVRRNAEGAIFTADQSPEAQMATNPVVWLQETAAPSTDASPLLFDVALAPPFSRNKLRLVVGGINVTPTQPVAVSGWPVGMCFALESMFSHMGMVLEDEDDASILVCPETETAKPGKKKETSLMVDTLSVPAPFDPILLCRHVIRTSRALDRDA